MDPPFINPVIDRRAAHSDDRDSSMDRHEMCFPLAIVTEEAGNVLHGIFLVMILFVFVNRFFVEVGSGFLPSLQSNEIAYGSSN